MLADRPIKIAPLALDRNVGLIDSPQGPNRFGEPTAALLNLRNMANNPAKHRRMGRLNAALSHHFRQVSIREPIGDVPAHTQLDDIAIKRALSVHRVTGNRLRQSASREKRFGQSTRCPHLYQNLTQWIGVHPKHSGVKTYGARRTTERNKRCVESRAAGGSGMLR